MVYGSAAWCGYAAREPAPSVPAPDSPGKRGCSAEFGAGHQVTQVLRVTSGTEHHILRADIRQYFDRIDHDLLRARLKKYFRGQLFFSLLDRQLAACAAEPGTGVGQGSPFSPVLADLFLVEVDDQFFEALGGYFIRYMDDFILVVLGPRDEAERTLAALRGALADLHLDLNDKTSILGPREAVTFLGVRFQRCGGQVCTSVPGEVVQAKLEEIDEVACAASHRMSA